MTDRPDNLKPDPDDDDLAYLDETRPLTPPPRGTGDRPVVFEPDPGQQWFWPITNAIGLIVVVGVNYLANVVELNGQTTGDVVNRNPVPFQPAGWVFSIWGVIYVLLGAFVVYGLLPSGRRSSRVQRISPIFLVTNVANVTWIFLWHWEQFLASLITIAIMLASLLTIYLALHLRNPFRRSIPAEPPTRVQWFVVWLPFSVYLGWICVATLANLMVWLDRSGWQGGPFSLNVWAVIFVMAGTLVAAAFVIIAADVAIPFVFTVAFAGIAQRAWGDSILVSVSAAVFAVVCAVLAGLAISNALNRGRQPVPFGVTSGNRGSIAADRDEPPSSERSDGFQQTLR